jgi:hypothetical protein
MCGMNIIPQRKSANDICEQHVYGWIDHTSVKCPISLSRRSSH